MRSDLRLADLAEKPIPSKLMNVQIPAHMSAAIGRLAHDLGCSKTAAVVALLNEGLDRADLSLRGHHPPPQSRRRRRAKPGRPPKTRK